MPRSATKECHETFNLKLTFCFKNVTLRRKKFTTRCLFYSVNQNPCMKETELHSNYYHKKPHAFLRLGVDMIRILSHALFLSFTHAPTHAPIHTLTHTRKETLHSKRPQVQSQPLPLEWNVWKLLIRKFLEKMQKAFYFLGSFLFIRSSFFFLSHFFLSMFLSSFTRCSSSFFLLSIFLPLSFSFLSNYVSLYIHLGFIFILSSFSLNLFHSLYMDHTLKSLFLFFFSFLISVGWKKKPEQDAVSTDCSFLRTWHKGRILK